MYWLKIEINQNQIRGESASSFLIKMPSGSRHEGCVFWHPKKCVFRKELTYIISFSESWKFSVKKYGKGKHNRNEIISEYALDAGAMLRAFENQTVIDSPKEPDKITVERIIPDRIKPKETNPEECLKRC